MIKRRTEGGRDMEYLQNRPLNFSIRTEENIPKTAEQKKIEWSSKALPGR